MVIFHSYVSLPEGIIKVGFSGGSQFMDDANPR